MKILKLLALAFPLLLLISTASAEPYNISVDATKIYSEGSYCFPLGWTEPYDPKIACDTEGSNCIALMYEDNIYCSRGVRVIWSVDKFDSHASQIFTIAVDYNLPDAARTTVSWFNTYGLDMPYDVEYFPDYKAFFMVAKSKVYLAFTEDIDGGGPISPLPTVYDSVVTPFGTLGADLSTNCIEQLNQNLTAISTHVDDPWGLSFQDNNATTLLVLSVEYYDSGIGINPTGFLEKVTYDVTNSTTTPEYSCVGLYSTLCPYPPGTTQMNRMVGIGWKTPTDWRYHIRTDADYCSSGGAGDNDMVHDWVALNSPAANQDNLHHIFASNLYYREPANNTILQSLTNPPQYTSFGAPQMVYTEETGENINQSDADDTALTNLWIWSRENATTNNGIWVFRESNIPITIETDVTTPVTAILDCNPTANTTYSTTGSGDFFTIYTVCQNNNRIIFTNTKEPTTHIEYFDIDSSCFSNYFIKLKYADNPHEHEVEVRTFDENLPVPNATVTIESDVEYTDSNGIATFDDIDQITGATHLRNNWSTCEVRLSTDGTGISKDVEVEKVGFRTATKTISAPAKSFSDGFNTWIVDTDTSFSLRRTGMFLTINIRGGGDTEITSCPAGGYNVTITGPDLIKLNLGGQEILRNWADTFPAEFIMNHSTSPVNVTATLNTPNGEVYQESVDMVFDSEDEIYFNIPRGITNLTCIDECDCPETTCIDEYFYDKLGCIDGICQYTIEDCILSDYCDNVAGCFNTVTTLPCSSDADCSSLNTCLDATTMNRGVCGELGVCLNKTVECTTFCNETAGVCEEQRLCLQGTSQKFQAGANSYTFNCDQSNAGTTICGDEIQLLKDEVISTYGGIANVPVQPDGWNYIETTNDLGYDIYLFLAPKITCTETCDIEIEFCGATGCDEATGTCIGVGAGVDPLAVIFAGWAIAIQGFINYVFPNIYAKSIFSLILMIAVSILMFLLGRKDPNISQYILGMDVIIALIMTFVGFLPFYVGIIAVILAGFILYQGLFGK